MKRLVPVAFGVALLALLGGCVAATIGSGDGAGVGVFSYLTRDVKATYHVNMDTVWPATLKAIAQLNLTVERETIDARGGALAVRRADGTDVNIRLKPLDASSTRISVRVGWSGDKIKSVLIHDAILDALST